jgi:methyl-accepting chemotaxis protein
MGDLTATMGRLANGELATSVPRQDRRDEIGVMARSVEIFRKGLSDAEMLRAETRQAQDAAALRAQQITALVQEMEGVVLRTAEEITDASSALRQTAEGATVSASQARAQSEMATEASQAARDKAQSVAAATEELSGSIVEIARQASLSASISGSAAAEMREAEERVVRLSEAADRIGDVLNLINQIAGQTNLLALNATIEAARAGEAGKGFAVVAAEVKALAQQTARATNEISGHIAAIQAETKGTATAMRSVGGVIERAQESTVTIASAVEQQQAATNEIANNIQAVSTNSVTVEESCLETNRRIVDLLTNNTAVKDSADRLTVSAQGLKTEMARFFDRFRA